MPLHETRALNHEENRKKVCLICFNKSNCNITDVVLARIRRYFMPTYEMTNPNLPCGMCSRCRSNLLDISDGNKSTSVLPTPFDFRVIAPYTTATRSDPIPVCECQICEIARQSGKSMSKAKKGRPRKDESTACGPPEKIMTVCSACQTRYGRGIRHKCTVQALRKNIVELCVSTDTRTQELVATSMIKRSTEGYKVSTKEFYSGGSYPLQVQVGSKESSSNVQVSVDGVTKLQNVLSASNNDMKRKIIPFVRSMFGRTSVESFIGEQLQRRDKTCAEYFDCLIHDFECTSTNKGVDATASCTVVYCNDVVGLIDLVCEKRNLDKENVSIKIGIDTGGDFLKFCLNISNAETTEKPITNPSKKLIEKAMLDTSVKKLIIIAIAYKVKETYENVRYILQLLKIDQIDFQYVYAVDLKMANILCGLQSHSSAYPCMFCECPKKEFSNIKKININWKLRTIGEIKKQAQDYENKRRVYNPKASAKDFKSCVHSPMIQGEDKQMLIEIIPPPQLHLMLRVTNKMFHQLQSSFPKVAELWLQKIGLVQPQLHGGEFTGNMCRRLLNHAPTLHTIGKKSEIIKFATAFAAFNSVISDCFGQVLHAGFEESIKKFETAYMNTGMAITTAVHIVCVHLIHFCKLKNSSLGRFNEQASEAVHTDFKAMWISAGKVSENHVHFNKHLLDCIIRYNSRHL
jgi:hypothetical protein